MPRPRRTTAVTAHLHPLEPRRLFAAAAPGIYPFAPGAPLRLEDQDGTAAVFALTKSGLGQLTVADDLTWHLALSGTTTKSNLTIAAAGGDARATLASVASTTPVASFTAPQTDLAGATLSLSTNTLTLASINNSSLALSSPTKSGLSAAFSSVHQSALTSTTPIKSLKLTSWTGPSTSLPAPGSPPASSLSAPSIGTLTVTGDFSPSLTLTATKGTPLTSAKITGTTSGDWTIPANVGTLNLTHLTGDLSIAGSAKSVSLTDHVALLPVPSSTGGSLRVAGTAKFSSPGDSFQLNNTTLYPATTSDLYTYNDLHHLTHAGQSATYKRAGKPLTQSVLPSTNATYALQSATETDTYTIDENGAARLLTLTDSFAGPTGTLTFASPGLQLSPARFTLGQSQTYTAAATLNASDEDGTITATGDATYTTTFLGHELVKTPAGAFVAARFSNSLTFTARGTTALDSFTADVNITLTRSTPTYASPTTATLRTDTTTTLKLAAPQLKKTITRRATVTDLLLTTPTMAM